jgi:hypothetical protein
MQKNVKLGETYYQPVHQEDKSTHELAFEKQKNGEFICHEFVIKAKFLL